MSPLRVVLTTHDGAGAWAQTLDVATALQDRGHGVLIVHDGSAPTREQLVDLRQAALLMQYGGFAQPGSCLEPERAPAFHDWVGRIAEGFRADMIHATSPLHIQPDAPVPQLLFLDSTPETLAHAGVPNMLHAQGLREAVATAEALIVPSATMARAVADLHGRTAQVVLPGARRIPSRKARTPVLMAADRCVDAGAYETLDAALLGLAWHGRVTDPVAHGTYRSLDVVGHLSRRDEDALLGQAAVFAAPGAHPSSGLAAARAAAAGCALVLTDCEGNREVWGDAALYAPARDAGAWHEVLRHLWDAPSQRDRLAARARRAGRTETAFATGYEAALAGAQRLLVRG